MQSARSRPANLTICEDPDYFVRIIWPDGTEEALRIYQRVSWKRLSAICHARYFARRNPTCRVSVELVKE